MWRAQLINPRFYLRMVKTPGAAFCQREMKLILSLVTFVVIISWRLKSILTAFLDMLQLGNWSACLLQLLLLLLLLLAVRGTALEGVGPKLNFPGNRGALRLICKKTPVKFENFKNSAKRSYEKQLLQDELCKVPSKRRGRQGTRMNMKMVRCGEMPLRKRKMKTIFLRLNHFEKETEKREANPQDRGKPRYALQISGVGDELIHARSRRKNTKWREERIGIQVEGDEKVESSKIAEAITQTTTISWTNAQVWNQRNHP